MNFGFRFENSYLQLPDLFFQKIQPTPVQKPEFLLLNEGLVRELDLNFNQFQNADAASFFSGNKAMVATEPFAQAYAGHQFGRFNILGDGRALMLGEHLTEDQRRFDIHLKGSGQTQYSRRGDGRAALKPMLREYIISEAFHALGIPTTRSLAVLTTGEKVVRETEESGAILIRVAQSHIRVGTFEFAAAKGGPSAAQALMQYTIKRLYPELGSMENPALELLRTVIDRQAKLLAQWMQVGFIHGVMNTDNMAISSETIDFGPCAFMNEYDLQTVYSSIDQQGRYSYGNQPLLAQWNLTRFAETLLPLLDADEKRAVNLAKSELENFKELYENYFDIGFQKKLGFQSPTAVGHKHVQEFLQLLAKHRLDMTTSFRTLPDLTEFNKLHQSNPEFMNWHARWQQDVQNQNISFAEITRSMLAINPLFIPRNKNVEKALQLASEQNDLSEIKRLLKVLEEPFNAHDGLEYLSLPTSDQQNYRTFCGT